MCLAVSQQIHGHSVSWFHSYASAAEVAAMSILLQPCCAHSDGTHAGLWVFLSALNMSGAFELGSGEGSWQAMLGAHHLLDPI